MQPSITPSPSARATCAIRTASRIPPDFASLMFMPCARSRAGSDVGGVWQSSSTKIGSGERSFSAGPVRVAGRKRLLAVLDAELRELGQRLERLVERPGLVDVDHQRHAR